MFYMENTFIQRRKAILKREYFDRLFVRLLSSAAPTVINNRERQLCQGQRSLLWGQSMMMTVCRKLSLDECSLLIIGEWADWLSWCQIKALKQSIMGYQINVNQPQATWHLTTDKMEDRKSCDISSTRHLKSQQPRSCVTEEHLSRGCNRVMWRLHLSWFYKHQSLTGIMRARSSSSCTPRLLGHV